MNRPLDGVAIVGMAGRFPGAASIEEFWRNLSGGKESIARFTADELDAGAAREAQMQPHYVAARGVIAGADRFDAAFFGIAPAEALLIDPQQRVFLELCWNALEHAAIDTQQFPGRIGVYAGVSNNGYRKLLDLRHDGVARSGEFAAMLANEKDYVATRVAHRIGLTGPAISVYTACSTSLVAVAQAWYALMSWQCDAALAGGMNIVVPQESGYVPVEGGMESADGHCRPFDAAATGTVFSSGGGVVVLKRLADALAANDMIWAVIRGVGVNNDGADKASFSAPSVRGQAEAVRLALDSAGVSADSIGYVEAHGTGTSLGDPIEVEALARAYAQDRVAPQSCWLGSVKSNFGHLVAAAGVTGLIKTALMLHHEKIPPTLHFKRANPEIDFAATPFKVVDRVIDWPRAPQPRRAGVSSFGVGGTNAHAIVEEAPPRVRRLPPPRLPLVLPISARDESMLQRRADGLSSALTDFEDADLADVGWSLAHGRRAMRVRAAVVAHDMDEARLYLSRVRPITALATPRIVFLFPGQGSQHADMARELVATEPVFAATFERCCALASRQLGLDLRDLILPQGENPDLSSGSLLAQTRYAQPALFAVEYALAQLWQSWGVAPAAMIGHSVGEYVAACLAGVFSLEDAVGLIVARGAAMDAQVRGAMLSVHAPESELSHRLPGGIEIAAVNAPDSIVVGGRDGDIDEFARQLDTAQIASTRLRVSHAFHSALMESALPIFRRAFENVHLSVPSTPFYSCVTGKPITDAQATSPDYWCRQIRAPVRFADAAQHAFAADTPNASPSIALEVGPGQALTGLLRRRAERRERFVATLGPAHDHGSDNDHVAAALGQLWCLGVEIDWQRYFVASERRLVALPGYPFCGPRFWVDAAPAAVADVPTLSVAVSLPEESSKTRAALRGIVQTLSGEVLDATQDRVRLIELGLDSLAMTQMALELERQFGLRLKFRLLLDQLDTIEKLAAEIDGRKAADVQPTTAAVAMPRAVANIIDVPTASERDQPFGAAARITLHGHLEISPRARDWLLEFTARYVSRTAASKSHSEQHRSGMADPRAVTGFNPAWKELVYPLVVARSDGAHLWDIDGNRYIDLLNAFGANLLGYQPAMIKRALTQQIEAGFEIGPQHPLAGEVAGLIRELTGVERVAFCNTGSEAVMGAMRIARTVTGRKTIVIFKDSYHGIFDEVIVRGTRELHSIAAAPGILASAVENILVLDYGNDAALEAIAARAGELAAVMIEPVQARNPQLQPQAFVQALRAICDANGCALIFDEVITGFRLRLGGAQEFYGVRADIATYGKVIGGGLPLAAIGGKAKWLDALDGGRWQFGDASCPEAGVTYFAGTFVRHPLALAAAKATLTHLKEQGGDLQNTLNARTAGLLVRLNAFFDAQQAPLRAVGFGSLWRVRVDAAQPLADLFFYALRERGLHLYAQFNCFLTTAHGAAEIDQIVGAIEGITQELLHAQVLTRRRDGPHAQSGAGEHATSRDVDGGHADKTTAEVAPTDAQKEKWIACQFGDAANTAFNESQLLQLDGALDQVALERAVNIVCSRHEAFAMSFASNGNALRVTPFTPMPVAVTDLSGSHSNEQMQAHCAAAVARPFDLTKSPLARFELIKLAADRHVLLLVAHHLIFDGWSAAVFLGELATAYTALASARTPQLPSAQSFRAFARAEQERPTQMHLEYWKEQYATPPEPLLLPLDRPRSRQPDFSAGTIFHDLPIELATAVRAFAREHGVTVYSTLLAAFGVLMARLCGQTGLAIGIPFARQAATDHEHLIGDGVNTIPLRLSMDLHSDFATLARHCHRALLDAADHQEITLHTLLGSLDARQRSACLGLTDVVFNLNPRLPVLEFGDLKCSVRDCAKAALVQDLFFNFNDVGKTFTLDLHYRTALFNADTITRWINHYETLLSAAAHGNVQPVGALPLMDAAQSLKLGRHASDLVLRDLNCESSLLDLIRAQALRTPERIAIECEGRALTYHELLRQAGAVARGLVHSGVGKGDIVALCLPRSVEMLVALLGILASGAAYLPLDANYPQQRLQSIVDDAGVGHLIVTDRASLPAGLCAGRQLHVLDALLCAAPAGVDLLPHPHGEDLAYVLYTSGSSGTPKGVRVLHRNLVNCLLSMREEPGLEPEDVFCAVTALTFDIAGLELYLPLITGARVLLATDRQHRDPEALIELMRTGGATVLQTTPSLLGALIGAGRATQLPRLKLLVGGEVLPRDLADSLLPRCTQLWNLYGPTETTIWSTRRRVTAGAGNVSIGTPIANTRIYILDAQEQMVPIGVRGEIWIGGAGVADGYVGRAELTAERFRCDPFLAGERIYRTGDIGSWNAGELHYHGRLDTQIKLRGFRIEPGDIEAAALSLRGVCAAVAAVHPFGADDRRLVLYVVAPDADRHFAASLRQHLRAQLPPHMLPQHIEIVAAFAQTAHGKVDRNALPAPRNRVLPEAAPAAPVPDDALTQTLLRIWRQLLQFDDFDVDANFFDIGGDSLLSVELFQRAQAATGVNLPLATLLTAQTVREQARVFRDAGALQHTVKHRRLGRPARPTTTSDAWSPLVAIHVEGQLPPLLCMHAVGGNVLNYIPLARALGANQPVYGLQAVGLDGITPPLATIEEMAERYLREIRARFPHGPYYLCGGSMGGLIAFELALRLIALNEKVAFVGLFDTYGPHSSDTMSSRPFARIYQGWCEGLARARKLDPSSRRTFFSKAIAARVERGREALQAAWYRWRGAALPHNMRYRRIQRTHLLADRAYAPHPYHGPVTLFRAMQRSERRPGSRTLGWENVARGSIELIDLPGSHDTFIERPELARELRNALEKARAAESKNSATGNSERPLT